ncbi:MAG: GNAT family N-acetyltransferase [Acidimicrobiales bacterium]
MTEHDEGFEVRRVDALQLHELRRRVLRSNNPDVSVSDPRDEESSSLHFGGFLGDRLVVSASFFVSPSPLSSGAAYQLRYMATDFDVQGKGYGALVLEAAAAQLRTLGVEQVWANGRDTALGFYRATGWQVVEGSEHLSAETRLPHTVILKSL